MDLFELIEHIKSSDDAIQFLRDRGVLRSVPPVCPLAACQRNMTEVKTGRRRVSGGDEKMWRCPVHKKKKVSIRNGKNYSLRVIFGYLESFLAKSNLSPKKFVLFAYLWAHGVSSASQESLCGLSNHSAIDWNRFLRDVCTSQLLEHPIQLGGVGRVVQIGNFHRTLIEI
jgi:hypothetical protein